MLLRAPAGFLLAVVVSVIITACGGGGEFESSTNSTAIIGANVTGVVAIGEPIVGATVSFRCVAGSGVDITSGDGTFKASLGSAKFPCIARAEGGTIHGASSHGNVLHAVIPTGGVFNLTPLSELVAARQLGVSPISWWMAGLVPSESLTTNALTVALRQVVAAIEGAQGFATYATAFTNALTTQFVAVSTDPTDAALEKFTSLLQQFGISLKQLTQNISTTITYKIPAYPFGMVNGVECASLVPIPSCTFFNSTGLRISVVSDPDYNQYGNGPNDMWYVVFDAAGVASVFNNSGSFQYRATAPQFAGWYQGTEIGVGNGQLLEDIRNKRYFLGRNGVLYSNNSSSTNFENAIN